MERLTMIDGCGNDELARCMDCGPEKAGADLENCGMCEEGWQRALKRLAAYEDTGLEPEDIKELYTDDVVELAKMFRKMIESGEINHLKDLLQAEQDGRLVVLPCGTDVNLIRDGHSYKADHWNHTLTAFRDAPENKSGKQVALFSIEEAEGALKGGANMTDGAEKPYDRAGDDAESAAINDPEWKERMMQKFVGRR